MRKTRMSIALLAAAVACALGATAALAATITGTWRSERITGTNDRDTINGRGGSDAIR